MRRKKMARILVVDDALFMRRMLRDILEKEGHEIVAEGENAYEALKLYKKLKPDAVTLDIIMPEIDGLNVMDAIKKIVAFDSGANIIMVSAMGQQEMIIESIQAGAKDFVVKPFQSSRVIEAVSRLV
jgi:two-component system, chemotaxis family, chemotaxis protein CheY